ncbi:ABC transporter ATP-binding protein [Paenibacillus faecalis]|uniref:ABC transporter ATP-binding protein n=1 Tax=Paenibacillus faecalis TaxID=2079532 RepID=UPI00131A58E5|nr:ABC transporter ATP-binding protein [Paenibacillus faecalis]
MMNRKHDDIVVLDNLTKSYSAHELALHDVTLSIQTGEMVAITGPSGSGKSTLLNIIGGNIKNYAGLYRFLGKDFQSFNKKEIARIKNKHIGYVMQNFGLIEDMSVYHNLKLPLLFNQDIRIDQIGKLVAATLDKVNMPNYAHKKVRQLSGGEKQRVAIARAIINNPDLVIADEPTGALDSKTTLTIMELFKKLNTENEVTFLIATHNREVADRCDRIIVLKDGTIIEEAE